MKVVVKCVCHSRWCCACAGRVLTTLDPKFSIDIADCTVDCDILKRTVDRYMGIIFQPVGSTGTVFRQTIFEDHINASTPEGLMEPLRQLKVMTTGKESVDLQLGVEESYFLEVSAGADQVTDTNIIYCNNLIYI